MNSHVFEEAFGRIPPIVRGAVSGLTADQLAFRPNGSANSMAWLIWHLTRVQDSHIAQAAGDDEIWTRDGWADRFALPLGNAETGYGHSSDQVAAVRVESPAILLGYLDAVHNRTMDFVRNLGEVDLERIVDSSWDPPVTLGVRLVSVLDDCLQHAGQAAYVRGLLDQ